MANNLPKELSDALGRQMYEDLDRKFTENLTKQIEINRDDYEQKMPEMVWKPHKYAMDEMREEQERRFRDSMRYEWDKMQDKDPNEQFRRQTRKEIKEIKDAIRKIGILLDSDKPSEKVLEEHKMLREAYKKYKMIEALILGGNND